MLSNADIISFQNLWREQFGKEISREDAYEKGARLLHLVKAVYRPITVEQYQRIQQRQKEAVTKQK